MTHATTDAAEARAREVLEIGKRFLAACNSAWACGEPYHRVKTMMDRAEEFQKALDMYGVYLATAEAASGAGEREELAAFGASEAAGYQYPGGNQAAERAAFCAGAAHAASLPPAADPAMVTVLRQALEDVCDPLSYLQRKAEAEGSRLNGMAYTIANDIATVQRIARAALAAAPTIPATGEAKNDPA